MQCTICKQRIEDGEFYQGRGWQAQHIQCPQTFVDYVPMDIPTGHIDLTESYKTQKAGK